MGAYTVVLLQPARDFFANPDVDQRIKRIIRNKIGQLTLHPELGKPLLGELMGYRRLAVSYYRIIYKIVRKELVVEIIQIGLRRDVYD